MGNCKLFYRFSIPGRISLIHDTLSALEKEKSLNEALYSFHYTLLSHNLFNRLWRSTRLRKQSISLIYGFDAKAKGKLIVYHVNPIFNEDVEKSTETHEAKVRTPREAKATFNSSSGGLVSTEKLQLILFSTNF